MEAWGKGQKHEAMKDATTWLRRGHRAYKIVKNAAMKGAGTIPRRGEYAKSWGLLLRPDDFTADAPSPTRNKDSLGGGY